MDPWVAALWAYMGVALLSLFPTLRALGRDVKLNPGGQSFNEAAAFSPEARQRLAAHYSRIAGTLGYWKKRARIYTCFHFYSAGWTILGAWAVPLPGAVAPQVEGSVSKWLIVLVSSHVALTLSFHRGLKVAEGMKAFRHGESEFYDLYRRMLDRPHLFGESEEDRIDNYFSEVDRIRRLVRTAETDAVPNVDDDARKERVKDSDNPP